MNGLSEKKCRDDQYKLTDHHFSLKDGSVEPPRQLLLSATLLHVLHLETSLQAIQHVPLAAEP